MSTFNVELEERLIAFAAGLRNLTHALPDDRNCHLTFQLNYSAAEPALIYGEAQHADDPKEFLSLLKLCLRELRKLNIMLRIVKNLRGAEELSTDPLIDESGQLIAILSKSVKTKKSNMANEKKTSMEENLV